MIFSSIHQAQLFTLPKALETAISFLKQHDFVTMKPGVYEIEGRDIYAQVFDIETGPIAEKQAESHEHFIDVQFLASGKEKLGFTMNTGTYEIAEKIDERDLIFYKAVENEGFIEATPGCYCIFFPSDIHRPTVASGAAMTVRKVVVKVKCTLL